MSPIVETTGRCGGETEAPLMLPQKRPGGGRGLWRDQQTATCAAALCCGPTVQLRAGGMPHGCLRCDLKPEVASQRECIETSSIAQRMLCATYASAHKNGESIA